MFYHDSLIETFCSGSREQSTSHVHAHAFIELNKKKTVKVTRLLDYGGVLNGVSFVDFLASLFSCFDHFISMFDYSVGRSMLSCYHGVHGQRRRAFSDTNLFFARSIGT